MIAITDPGSKMQQVAEADKFGLICYGDPAIGGRYSAHSDFGIVAGAVMGIDTGPPVTRGCSHGQPVP